MKLRHPPAETEWLVVKSFLVNHPAKLCSDTLAELRSQVALVAREANRHREPKKRIKSLEFHYLTDEHDMVVEVRVFFKGFKNTVRLMKLVKIPANAT
jgi:hypothetical protein